MKSYNHFSQNERFFIARLFNDEKESIRQIAKKLGRSPSSISREIKRNTINGTYDHTVAQKKAKDRAWHRHFQYLNKYKEFTKRFKKIYDKRYCGVELTIAALKEIYPEMKCPSMRQVFRWIRVNRWSIGRGDRLRQQYNKGGKRTVGVFSAVNLKSVRPIWVRPKKIDKREEFGHWEGDLILGKRANGYRNILTLNERKTRMLFACFVPNKNPWKINTYVKNLIFKNKLNVKTLTLDNGLEFERIGLLAKRLNIIVYMCEPYASYQRGSNEHLNGLIRRFWKKGTDFNNISDYELKEVVLRINKMKRKLFNYKSAYDIYINEKDHLKRWS